MGYPRSGNPNVVTVIAFGGAGPVHAYGLAKKLGAPRVIVPPNAGVGSALGFFTAPRAFDLVRSHKVSLDEADFHEVEKIFKEMEREGAKTLQKTGETKHIQFERSLDMRFVGQGAETNVFVSKRNFTQVKREEVRSQFDDIYENLYGRTYPDSPVEFIGQRPAYSGIAKDFIPYTVYDRYKLFPGAQFQGPAVIEERESTVIVGEDASVSVDDHGFLWIDLKNNLE
jgi:N-methylhydantoinase A